MGKLKKVIRMLSGAALLLMLHACIEPFEAETQSFEDLLVVDGLLTTEVKKHHVKLSRTFAFEDEGISSEEGALVRINDNLGNSYSLSENEPGIYETTVSFGATPGVSYQLQITTRNGKEYTSKPVTTPSRVAIESLTAVRGSNNFGEQGVHILLSNRSALDGPKHFRYEYEETFKIIAPFWDPFEMYVVDSVSCADGDPAEIGIRLRQEEQRICYKTTYSTDIIQASTETFEDNEISNFRLLFLNRENYAISHRYSIFVKQFSQTPEAYSFTRDLRRFALSENLFSEIQPGFLEGNIQSEKEEEPILGYFEVASVSFKRLYFNYQDLFPGEDLPSYPVDCQATGNQVIILPGYECDGTTCIRACQSPLLDAVKADIITYAGTNETYFIEPLEFGRGEIGPYFTKAAPCGDCTKLGSNKVPEFWEE